MLNIKLANKKNKFSLYNLKFSFFYFKTFLQHFQDLSKFKENQKLRSIGTGVIMPVEKHPSLHVKHGLMNAKYNIKLTEGNIYVPFNCEIVNISQDYSTILLKSLHSYHFVIYLDKCSMFLDESTDFYKLKKGMMFQSKEKLLSIDCQKCYANGCLPIVSFCINQDFDFMKVFYGNTVACENYALLYF